VFNPVNIHLLTIKEFYKNCFESDKSALCIIPLNGPPDKLFMNLCT
jgi:hypothetical protein